MGLSKQQKILVKSFVAGAAVGLAFIYFAGDWLKSDHSTVEFKKASSKQIKALTEAKDGGGQQVVSYASAVEAAAPAVVNIHTAKVVTQKEPNLSDDPLFRRFFGDELSPIPRKRLETSLGSGVIVSAQGYILTNNHVIEEADEIQVALRDSRNAEAMVVGTDPESDVAVLKIEMDDLPVITMGESDTVRIGDVVLAIGNPYGVGQTVTMGIVSATGRDRLGINTFENFIQTDAAINPGNSGGALINAYGHLVGINTAIFTRTGGSEGIGFAIPVAIAKDVTQQIIEHGHAIRGWLGIEIQDITPALAESFGLDAPQGVIVAGVLRNGPGQTAGLKPGDIITKVDGKAVEDSRQAVNLIAQAAPGTQVRLDIVRDRKALTLNATTNQRPLPKDQH